jgi:hypothetical protein
VLRFVVGFLSLNQKLRDPWHLAHEREEGMLCFAGNVKIVKSLAALSDVSEVNRRFAIAHRAGFRPKEENL